MVVYKTFSPGPSFVPATYSAAGMSRKWVRFSANLAGTSKTAHVACSKMVDVGRVGAGDAQKAGYYVPDKFMSSHGLDAYATPDHPGFLADFKSM